MELMLMFRVCSTLFTLFMSLKYSTLVGYFHLSALHIAAKNGETETVKCLLEHGADVNLQSKCNIFQTFMSLKYSTLADYSQQTALHIAVETGNEEIVKCLLEHRAKVDLLGRSP
jgi:ankyrin repeat protein